MYDERRQTLLQKLLTEQLHTPQQQVSFTADTLLLPYAGLARRVGRPKLKWLDHTLELFWTQMSHTLNPEIRGTPLNRSDPIHIQKIYAAALTPLFSKIEK